MVHRKSNTVGHSGAAWDWQQRELGRIGGGWRRYFRQLDAELPRPDGRLIKRHNTPGFIHGLILDLVNTFKAVNPSWA